MNFNKKSALAWAIAATLGGLSSQAGAVVYLGVTGQTNTPAKYVKEEDPGTITGYKNFGFTGTNQTTPTGALTVQFPVIPSYKVTSTDYLFVKIALTGGAKFAAEPKLVCKASGVASWSGFAGVNNTARAVIINPTSAANGKSVANFLLASGFKTFPSNGTTGGCYLVVSGVAAASYTIASRSADMGVSAVVGYRFAGVPTTTTRNGKFITFQSALVPYAQGATFPGGTAANVVVDVKQGSQKFDSTTTLVNATTAYLGSIKVGLSTANLNRASTTLPTITVASALNTVTVRINGAPLAGAASVYLSTTNLCIGSFASKVAGTTAVTFSAIAPTNFILPGGVNVCMVVDGTKNVNAGQITANISGAGKTGYLAKFPTTDYKLVEVKRNGASLTVLNIAPPTSADQSYVRFYNGGSKSGTIRGTLYTQTGTVVGTANTTIVANLAANAVKVTSAADLATLFGTWVGRAWLRIDAEVDQSQFSVQSLLRDPTGTLVNVSGQVVKDQ